MNLFIDNKSGAPIYEQLYTQIKNQILSGELQPEEAMPSIRGLARDLRISVITTKRAYDELEAAGFHNYPIVLHGASSVDQRCVAMCNEYGGNIAGAKGIPAEMLRKASSMAVCKINMDTDLRLAMTAAVRKVFAEKPAEFDPRKYLGPARDNMEKLYKHKIINVLGSDNKLAE